MDLKKRIELAKSMARQDDIDNYRNLLRSAGARNSDMIMFDRKVLAESLVYELLGYYAPEAIEASLSSSYSVSKPTIQDKKKAKSQQESPNTKNTRTLRGQSLKTRISRLLNSSIPTGSDSGEGSGS